MPFLDRGCVKIYYEDHGHGPAILLSHGYGATCRMWDAQIAALAPHYRIVVWDMRGHGESDDPADPAAYSEALTVEDMAALLRDRGIERAITGGLSLGGQESPCIRGLLTAWSLVRARPGEPIRSEGQTMKV